MSSKIEERWAKVCQLVAADPSLNVPCPVCGQDVLSVTDVRHIADQREFDRHLACVSCGATHQVRLLRDSMV